LQVRTILFIEKIRKTYASGDYGKCVHRLEKLGVSDDETEYLYTKSYFGRAKDFYREGKLNAAEECFNKALSHAERTVYIDPEFTGAVSRYLQTIQTVRDRKSVMAVSEETDGIREFLSEIMYLNLLNGNFFDVISRDFIGPYADHLLIHRRIAEMSSDEQINDFMEQLRNILEHLDEKKYAVLKYYILSDLEALAQKMGDYKCAYECSSARLSLSTKMNT
jgi:tetratricopeptide (TPR) repeat protein